MFVARSQSRGWNTTPILLLHVLGYYSITGCSRVCIAHVIRLMYCGNRVETGALFSVESGAARIKIHSDGDPSLLPRFQLTHFTCAGSAALALVLALGRRKDSDPTCDSDVVGTPGHCPAETLVSSLELMAALYTITMCATC